MDVAPERPRDTAGGMPVLDAAELAARRDEILARGRPAVVTGLFRGHPLMELSGIAAARDRLGALPVMMGPNYIDAQLDNIRNFMGGTAAPIQLGKRPGTLGEYLDLVEREPQTRWLISEQPTPAALLDGLDLSPLGVAAAEGGYGSPFDADAATRARSLTFAANRGNASDLHTDWDGRDVVLFQLFGRKRIVLFPPHAAPLLHPIDIFSTLRLGGMDDAARRRLLDYAGGVEHVLRPGEGMFMPAFWWHHVDYLDPAMSVSFRFGGVRDPDALALLRGFHRDRHVQGIIAGVRDPARAEACRAAARRLREEAALPFPGALARYRAMRRLAAELHRSTWPGGALPHAEPVIGAEDFLDGALCAFYRRPPAGPAPLRRLAAWRERAEEALRRVGRRLAARA
jgi:lysine-specific demethylase 8